MYVFLWFPIFIDWVYVDNIAYAHFLAEVALSRKNNQPNNVAGDAFYVSNEEPMGDSTFRQMVIHYAKIHNVFHWSPRAFYLLAYISLMLRRLLKSKKQSMGNLEYLTPCAMVIMNINMRIDPSKAQRMLPYRPVFNVNEGIQLAVREYQEKESIFGM